MSIRKVGNIDTEADRKAVERAIEVEMEALGIFARDTMRRYLDKHDINVDRQLYKSLSYQVERVLNKIRLQFGSNVKHGIFVHDGTKPHWTPVKPIRRWVFKKLGFTGAKLDSVTWFVRKKIASKGTEAKPFAETAWRQIRRTAPMKIEAAIMRGLPSAG